MAHITIPLLMLVVGLSAAALSFSCENICMVFNGAKFRMKYALAAEICKSAFMWCQKMTPKLCVAPLILIWMLSGVAMFYYFPKIGYYVHV